MDMIPRKDATDLHTIFKLRASQSPDAIAYEQYDKKSRQWQSFSWSDTATQLSRWQQALKQENIAVGERIAIMVANCHEWILLDQAAQSLGIVVVPVYTNDRADNVAYILEHAGVELLLIDNAAQLKSLLDIRQQLQQLKRVVSLTDLSELSDELANLSFVDDWLPPQASELTSIPVDGDSLATIVYTSGTTGKPKGVMLSHNNILANIYAGLSMVDVLPGDKFLSFLPLSHMLERSIGYYLPIVTGSSVAFSRSIAQLASDLLEVQPSIMISVPRIFERVYARIQDKLATESAFKQRLFRGAINIGWKKFEHQQHRAGWSPVLLLQPLLDKLVGAKVRARLGGQLRFTVCGGAALSDGIARFFIGLGIPILQGYGLTETSPVISVNTLDDNIPSSVGLPLTGTEIRVGDNDELQTRSASNMLGYWQNPQATSDIISDDGWLHTGDKVRVEQGHIFITGRIKEIIVLANGEKVPPSDMELTISLDNLIDQVLIVGEGKAYLSALVVLNEDELERLCQQHNIDLNSIDYTQDRRIQQEVLGRIKAALHGFPGYAKIRKLTICPEAWSIENGMMTPTLKLKRNLISERHQTDIEQMYVGHN
jgi:long-chain acyl-CoA synthetase